MSIQVEDWSMDGADVTTEQDCLRSIRTTATSHARVCDFPYDYDKSP